MVVYIYLWMLMVLGVLLTLQGLDATREPVLAVIGVLLLGFAIVAYFRWRRIQNWTANVQASLDAGRLEEAIAAHDGLVGRFNDYFRGPISFLRINPVAISVSKAGLLWAKGDFDQAVQMLDAVDFESLPIATRPTYVLNRFSALVWADRLDDAKRHYENHRSLIADSSHPGQNAVTQIGLRSAYEFHFGDLEESRKLTLEALEHKPEIFNQAFYHFRLGRIALQTGDLSTASTHFEQAADLGKGTFIPDKITELIAQSDLNP